MSPTPKLRLEWTLRAREDLVSIADYIARDSPKAAELWVAKLVAAAESCVDTPGVGRRVPELKRADLLELIVGNYRLVFRATDRYVQVLTVFEGHRRFPRDVR